MSFNKGTSKTFKVHDGKKTKNLYFTFLSSERNFNTNVPGGTGGNSEFIVTEAKASHYFSHIAFSSTPRVFTFSFVGQDDEACSLCG